MRRIIIYFNHMLQKYFKQNKFSVQLYCLHIYVEYFYPYIQCFHRVSSEYFLSTFVLYKYKLRSNLLQETAHLLYMCVNCQKITFCFLHSHVKWDCPIHYYILRRQVITSFFVVSFLECLMGLCSFSRIYT